MTDVTGADLAFGRVAGEAVRVGADADRDRFSWTGRLVTSDTALSGPPFTS